jgi:hypothetical protein
MSLSSMIKIGASLTVNHADWAVRVRTIKATLMFYFLLALPLGFVLALIFSVLFRDEFAALLLRISGLLFLVSLYIAYLGLRIRRKLELQGRILGCVDISA